MQMDFALKKQEELYRSLSCKKDSKYEKS